MVNIIADYNWLKIIHVISSIVLFGTGLGTAIYMLLVNFQKDVELIAKATAQVVFIDFWFTGISGIVQPITGFAMVYLYKYPLFSFWIVGSVTGYLIAGICWFIVVWLQIRCRDLAIDAFNKNTPLPKSYHKCFKTWWILGIPAFISLMFVFYLMTNRPAGIY